VADAVSILGTVYLLHFSRPYYHARHYLGWTVRETACERFQTHVSGQGSGLVRAAVQAGITVELACTWEQRDRHFERALKRLRAATELCPLCRADRLARKARAARERRRRARKTPVVAGA
jgi:hypothetical protein